MRYPWVMYYLCNILYYCHCSTLIICHPRPPPSLRARHCSARLADMTSSESLLVRLWSVGVRSRQRLWLGDRTGTYFLQLARWWLWWDSCYVWYSGDITIECWEGQRSGSVSCIVYSRQQHSGLQTRHCLFLLLSGLQSYYFNNISYHDGELIMHCMIQESLSRGEGEW